MYCGQDLEEENELLNQDLNKLRQEYAAVVDKVLPSFLACCSGLHRLLYLSYQGTKKQVLSHHLGKLLNL